DPLENSERLNLTPFLASQVEGLLVSRKVLARGTVPRRPKQPVKEIAKEGGHLSRHIGSFGVSFSRMRYFVTLLRRTRRQRLNPRVCSTSRRSCREREAARSAGEFPSFPTRCTR